MSASSGDAEPNAASDELAGTPRAELELADEEDADAAPAGRTGVRKGRLGQDNGDEDEQLGPRRPYLTFLCGSDRYAASILKVREILGVGSITRVPSTPAWTRGVMNLRGSVLPVIDLAVKVGLPPTEINSRTCIVVTEVDLVRQRIVLGVLVDSVQQVIELADSQIEAPPSFGTRVHVRYLRGVVRVAPGELALVLDLDRVLTVDELLTAASLEAPDDEDTAGEDTGDEDIDGEDTGDDASPEDATADATAEGDVAAAQEPDAGEGAP